MKPCFCTVPLSCALLSIMSGANWLKTPAVPNHVSLDACFALLGKPVYPTVPSRPRAALPYRKTNREFSQNLAELIALIVFIACVFWLSTQGHAADKLEKLRAAYPAVAPGSTPSWITADKKIWSQYGYHVETILVSGGSRAVPALVSGSVQFLFGSDTGVTTAQLQGVAVVRLGVTMNTLGSSLITQPGIDFVRELKGKVLGISRGRDASYVRLAKLLRDNGLNPNDDVKFLSIGGGEAGRLSAVKAGVIHGTMLFPPLDLIAKNEGLKVLAKFDVPTPGGGINTTATLLKQNRPMVVNFLKGYIEGIHYMNTHKAESLQVLQKYFQNSDMTAMAYLYDETTRRLEKDLRATPESIRFHLEMAALDDPRAAKLSEKEFWDPSVVEEIRRSGFIDQLYKK